MLIDFEGSESGMDDGFACDEHLPVTGGETSIVRLWLGFSKGPESRWRGKGMTLGARRY